MVTYGNNPIEYLDEFNRVVPEVFSPLVNNFGFEISKPELWKIEYRSERLIIWATIEATYFNIDMGLVSPIDKLKEHITMGYLIKQSNPNWNTNMKKSRNIKYLHTNISITFSELLEYCSDVLNGDFSKWPRKEE